jgi:hypothetical protein
MPIIDVDYQRLLDFANGSTAIYGYTANSPTSSIPLSSQYTDVGPALSYLAEQGWTVVNVIAENAKVVWFLSHA